MTDAEKENACKLARSALECFLRQGQVIEPPAGLPAAFCEPGAAFVTLHLKESGALRGCIGSIIPHRALSEDIIKNAIQAAVRDPRFDPVSADELAQIELEVSVLTPPKPLHYWNVPNMLSKIRPGIDGVIIYRDHHQATFLPSVWEQLPEKETFMQHLCAKAGLPPDAYLEGNLEVMTYQAEICREGG
ncbi:MAG: AmmeMemoRadiSam system protein A [Campylobacterales bacterium]